MSLIAMFDEHCKLATRKSVDGITGGNKKQLSYHVRNYEAQSEGIYNRATFIRYLAGLDVSQSTKSVLASRLGKFLYWSEFISKEDFEIIKSSFRQVIRNWSERVLDADDIPRIIESAFQMTRSQFTGVRNQLMIYLLSTIGMRISQLLELKMSDVWVENGILRLAINKKKDDQAAGRPKIEIKSLSMEHTIGRYSLLSLYSRYTKLRMMKGGDCFFISHQCKMISDTYMRVTISEISKRLGLRHLSPHSFRHFVGHTVTNEHGITKAAILLGHSNIAITAKYVNPALVDTTDIIHLWRTHDNN